MRVGPGYMSDTAESRRIRLGSAGIAGACLLAVILFAVIPSGAPESWTLQPLISAAVCAIGSSLSFMGAGHVTGKERRFWRIYGFMLAFEAAGWAAEMVVSLVAPDASSINAADVPFLLTYLALVPLALLMTEPHEVMVLRRWRNGLDLAAMVVWTFAFVSLAVTAPLMTRNGDVFPLVLSGMTYAVVSLGLLLYLMAFKRREWRSWELAFALGLLFSTLGHVIHVHGATDAASAAQAWPWILGELSWLTASLSFAAAPVLRLSTTKPVSAQRVVRPEFDVPRWTGIAVQAFALATVPLFLIFAQTLEPGDPGFYLMTASAILITALVMGRSFLVTIENRQMMEKNLIDPLTGLYNSRYCVERLQLEASASDGEGRLSVAVVDIDGFDAYNRRFGHARGDRLLHDVSGALAGAVRGNDILCRTASDRFVAILPETETVEALVVAQRLLTVGLRASMELGSAATLTAGIASMPTAASDSETLLKHAEGALYWAKRHQRATAVIYDPAVVDVLNPEEHVERLEHESHVRLIEAMAAAVDARDPYTQFHSRNVADLSVVLARAAGWDDQRIALLESAALMHDVGKIGIPDAVLRKPERLDRFEYEQIREHPVLGEKILRATEQPDMLRWVRSHHERWDGTGYPDGLAGEQIPAEARLMSVCDAYDAMVSDRPYRKGRTPQEACAELIACSGTHFDAEMVRLFVPLALETPPRTSPLSPENVPAPAE